MSSEKPAIHTGHRARMRSRLYETGLDGFQPHEVLELLLYCVIPKRDVNPLAHALLDRFGSVGAVLAASPEELTRVPGVGMQTAEFFSALSALPDAYLASPSRGVHNLATLADALRFVPESARASARYGVTVIFADRFNRPLSVRSFPGRPDDPAVIRAILEKTLALHSHSAVLFITGFRHPQPLRRHELNSFHNVVKALIGVDSFAIDVVLLTQSHLLSLRQANLITGNPRDIQGNLSRRDYWLGPLADESSETGWFPVSLLENTR